MKRLIQLFILFATLATLSACQTLTPPSQAPKSELRLFQNVHQHTLDNGLTVIIKEDKRAPVVSTQIWYQVGSNDEPKGKGGISHFVEHLMFKDTPKVSGAQFDRLINYYGGIHNAYTSQDTTVYHQTLPANRYTLALELEANRMKNVRFDPQQIHQERQVIKEERRQRTDDDPMARAREQFLKLVYGDTPRSRPVIGSMADIEGLSVADLQHWYTTWYAPNNATLVIVGDVNATEALAHVQKYFGDIGKSDAPPKRQAQDFIHPDDLFAGQGGVSVRHLDVHEAVQVPTLILAWQAPSVSSLRLSGHFNERTHREILALGLFSDVLNGDSGRFAKNLIKTQKVSFASSTHHTQGHGDGFFMISATPKAGISLEQTKQLILQELHHAMSAPITQKELERSLVATKTAFVFALEGVSGQARIFGELNANNATFDDVERELQMLPTITPDDIKDSAKKYLAPSRMYSAYILPKEHPTQNTTSP